MKNKVIVPNAKKLISLYPSQCLANPLNIEQGDLKTRIIMNLYTKALLKENKVLISKLGKGYDRKDILKIYEMIMVNINNSQEDM